MPVKRYFIDKNGAKTTRMQGKPGEGHIDIAREVLERAGIAPADSADHYTQMYRLKYMRVVEQDDERVEVEFRGKLSSAQKQFIAEQRQQGRLVFWNNDREMFND
jgi:hypothetical protein